MDPSYASSGITCKKPEGISHAYDDGDGDTGGGGGHGDDDGDGNINNGCNRNCSLPSIEIRIPGVAGSSGARVCGRLTLRLPKAPSGCGLREELYLLVSFRFSDSSSSLQTHKTLPDPLASTAFVLLVLRVSDPGFVKK